MDACDRALALDEAKRKSLSFVESRMGRLAPNLSAVVGSAIASQLVGAAGGLLSLAGTPSCNVLVRRLACIGMPDLGDVQCCQSTDARLRPERLSWRESDSERTVTEWRCHN